MPDWSSVPFADPAVAFYVDQVGTLVDMLTTLTPGNSSAAVVQPIEEATAMVAALLLPELQAVLADTRATVATVLPLCDRLTPLVNGASSGMVLVA